MSASDKTKELLEARDRLSKVADLWDRIGEPQRASDLRTVLAALEAQSPAELICSSLPPVALHEAEPLDVSALGMDGHKWAEAFCARFPVEMDDAIGWFCNAIMAGFDEATRRYQQASMGGSEPKSQSPAVGGGLIDIVNQVHSDLQFTMLALQNNDPNAEVVIRVSDVLAVIQDKLAPLLRVPNHLRGASSAGLGVHDVEIIIARAVNMAMAGAKAAARVEPSDCTYYAEEIVALASLITHAGAGANSIGAAELAVGQFIYRRIEKLMDAKAGTPEAAELSYLAAIASDVEEYGATGDAEEQRVPFVPPCGGEDELVAPIPVHEGDLRENIREAVIRAVRFDDAPRDQDWASILADAVVALLPLPVATEGWRPESGDLGIVKRIGGLKPFVASWEEGGRGLARGWWDGMWRTDETDIAWFMPIPAAPAQAEGDER